MDEFSIKTLVVGLPGSEGSSDTGPDPRTWMSEAARAGNVSPSLNCSDTGTPRFCHEDLSQVSDLQTSLASLFSGLNSVDTLVSCELLIPPAPSGQMYNPNKVTIAIEHTGANGESVNPCLIGESNSDCQQGDGWYWASDNETINLCPKTCATVQQDPTTSIELLAGCRTAGPIQ